MADSFHKIQSLRPLRLTVAEVARIGDEVARQVDPRGNGEIEYAVDFEDDTQFTRDSSTGFLANVDDDGERIEGVTVRVTSPRGSDETSGSKYVRLGFRSFGSDLQVRSDDVNWGRGAVVAFKSRIERHTPWFSPVQRAVPMALGLLMPLPLLAVAVASGLEGGFNGLVALIAVLAALLQVALIWFTVGYFKGRRLAHTVIYRAERTRTSSSLKLALTLVGVAADVTTLLALLVVVVKR